MRTYTMHSPYSTLFIAVLQSTVVLLAVPAEFWTQLDGFLDIPESVKLLTVPLFGSLVAIAFEYLIELKNKLDALKRGDTYQALPASYWWIKIGIGWIVGVFGGSVGDSFIKAEPVTIAFWSGVGGHGAIAIYLAVQTKKVNDTKRDDSGNP